MASSNRRFAVHIDVTGPKNIEKQQVVRIQAVTFGHDGQQEEYNQLFLPSVPISKESTKEHGYTKQQLKKLHAPRFSKKSTAKFVEFIGNREGFSGTPYKVHILNNGLRKIKQPTVPQLEYPYRLFKELHPEKRKDHPQGQHPVDLIARTYPVGELKGAYKTGAVQLALEAEALRWKNQANTAAEEKNAPPSLKKSPTVVHLSLFKGKRKVADEAAPVVKRPRNAI